MTNGLNELLANNAEISQYYSSLPQSVKNEVSSCGLDITSLEELLKIIQQCQGS